MANQPGEYGADAVRQIFFAEAGRVVVRDAPAPPPPGRGQVILHPAYVGICGTDLLVLHGRHAVSPPLVIGHEVAGIVGQVGAGVEDLAPGDRVALNPVTPCGECPRCRRGAFNICDRAQVIGFRLPGAAQTALTVPARQLHRLPEALRLDQAAMAEPMAVAVHAVATLPDLEKVLVIGGGTIGLCIVSVLTARGAGHITLVEPVAAKRELARTLGVAEAVEPGKPPPAASFTGCFDVVANQTTMDLAEGSCMSGGTIVAVGSAPGPCTFNLPRLQRYEITLRGSSIFRDADMAEALRLLGSRAVDAGALITGIRELDEAAEAYADAMRPVNVKTLIHIDGGQVHDSGPQRQVGGRT